MNKHTYLYEVTYRFSDGFQTYVEVRASNHENAENQVRAAHPNCEIVSVSRVGN